MEFTIKCQSCGSSWRVNVQEGVSIMGELLDCPLCKTVKKETK